MIKFKLHYLIKYQLCFIILLFANILYSQNITKNQIDIFIDKNFDDYQSKNLNILKEVQEHKIHDFESKVLKTKDNDLLLYLYEKLVFKYIEYTDKESANEFFKKIETIVKKNKNKRNLGIYYFAKAQLAHYSNDTEAILNYGKAVNLLEKYEKTREYFLSCFYLSRFYADRKQYDLAIEYGLKAKKSIDNSGLDKEEYFYVYSFLFEGYLNENKIDSAQYYMQKTDNENVAKAVFLPMVIKFNNQKALFWIKKNEFAKAINNIKSSDSISRISYMKQRSEMINLNLKIINLKNKQIKNNQIAAELKEKKYQNRLIALLLIVLIVIIVFLVFYSFFKSKTNSLLKQKNKELDVLLNSKNVFIDTIAHEIRTPINTIKGITYLLNQNKGLVTNEEFIKILNFSSDHLHNLINNFVHHNGFITNEETVNTNQVGLINLNNLVQNIINFYIVEKQNNNKYILNFDSSIDFEVYVDAIKLSQVLINILNNSSKFTTQGNIEFNVKLLNKYLDDSTAKISFEIKDNGIGINNEKIKEIFEPFKQEDDSINYSYGGLGLGLSIVKSIIESMGGEIKIESQKNIGTIINFVIDFKIAVHEGVKDEENIVTKNQEVKLLLVEDNKINQMITKKIINNFGYICDVADNGLEALEKIKSNNYSVIFMDIMMPIMDGFEAAKKIKNYLPNLPIIALSSISEKINQEKIKEAKFDKFLSKPATPNAINDIISIYCK